MKSGDFFLYYQISQQPLGRRPPEDVHSGDAGEDEEGEIGAGEDVEVAEPNLGHLQPVVVSLIGDNRDVLHATTVRGR